MLIKIPSPRSKKKARIEIIPLIDIMFFLLATFVMVSISMVKNQGIQVHLPTAATGTQQDKAEPVLISVESSGRYYWNQEAVDLAAIIARLQNLAGSNPDARIVIRGDSKASFESVVAVLDQSRKAGVTKVTIQTTAPPIQ